MARTCAACQGWHTAGVKHVAVEHAAVRALAADDLAGKAEVVDAGAAVDEESLLDFLERLLLLATHERRAWVLARRGCLLVVGVSANGLGAAVTGLMTDVLTGDTTGV